MHVAASLPVVALLALGAFHGLNPAMGWLFAVALGLQERDRRRVWGALAPLALGHALAIGAAVLAAAALGLFLPIQALRWVVAAVLAGVGVAHLVRRRHPRWSRMRVRGRDLTLWSFLMATAHGAGLMVLPFILGVARGGGAEAPPPHGAAMNLGGAGLAGLPEGPVLGIVATALHTLSYLAVTGVVAVIVYERLGLRLLRSAWINVDLLWALALIAVAILTPFL